MPNISLLKVCGACAVLTAMSLLVALILLLVAVDIPDTDEVDEIFLALDADRTVYLTAQWFVVLGLVLAMAAALGFYQALRAAGGLMWIAVVAFVAGDVFVIAKGFIELGVVLELVPGYVAASEATRPALEVMGDTLRLTGVLAVVVGNMMTFGVGVALFALATIRTAAVPRWIGGLGLVVAMLGGWLGLLAPVSGAFEIVSIVGSLAFVVWMVLMGVALLRLPEPPTSQPLL